MSNFKKIVKRIVLSIVSLPLLTTVACTEAISIDPPKEKIVPVIEGSFTNEYKRHEVILSYSSELYSHEREMITGAEVYIIESRRYH